MSCEYVREHYGVPAVIGRRVVVGGKPGIIAEDRGHYIGVNFDADKPGVVCNAHPTSEVEYGEMGVVRKMTRSQQRYRDYCWADSSLTFAEWIGAA
jgi:hypothetical protein